MCVEVKLISFFNLVVVSQLHAPAAFRLVKRDGTLDGPQGRS